MTLMASREEEKVVIPPPIRGMNTFDPPHRLPEGQGVDLWNVEIDEVLGIEKRSGFTPFNTAATLIPRYNAGTVKSITGPMVYFSGSALTASVCAASDVFFMPGNSSAVFWQIAARVGTATISLAVAYSQTVTASTYILGPKEVGSIHDYKYGTTQKLLAFAGSEGFQAAAGATGNFAAISTGGLTDYQRVRGVTFQDVFYFCNGYEFKSYDGSTVSTVSGSPSPSDPLYVCVYTIGNANFLCIAGSNTNADKSRFSFSDVNAPGTWPTANRYFAGDRDGGVVTGVAPAPGGVVIFKDNGIFTFTGIPGSGSLRKVSSKVGCTAPDTIKAHKGEIYFVGREGGRLGLFRFDGVNVISLSRSIEPTLNTLALGNENKFSGEIYEDKYFLVARSSSGTYNDRHFLCYIDRPFDYLGTPYFPWVRGDRGANFALNQVVSGTNYLFTASPTGGFVYREDTGTSDDTTDNYSGETAAINAYADTAWLDFGDNSKNKELLRAYIDATQSGNWNLVFSLYKDFQAYGADSYNINLGATVMTWADVVFLSTPWQTAIDKAVTELVFNYPSFAKFFKLRWANANSGQTFSVYPITVYFKRENV